MSALIESPVCVSVTVHVDPVDVVRGLDNNDDRILTFICQLIALAGSHELRHHLLQRLGVDTPTLDQAGRGSARVDMTEWSDEEFIGDRSEQVTR